MCVRQCGQLIPQTWTINGRTLTLPAQPSTTEVDGVIDNASYFRYSKNYLNWLFFATGTGSYIEESTVDDGTDLPDMSRFYYAKKAIMTGAKGTGYQAKFGIYYFSNVTGGSQAQPLMFAVKAEPDGADNDGDTAIDEFDEILTSAFMNNINNMHTVTYSPLAEGLSTIGYYYSSPSSGASGGYCQNNFTIVISPGVSSEDQGTTSKHVPASLSDYDMDAGGIGEGNIKEDSTTYAIPVNQNGSTYLDDVAYYLYANDIVGDAPDAGSLCYDGLIGTFLVGETVTGGSFGATGEITAVNPNAGFPNTGCLEIENISGNFIDDEALTSAGGTAVVNGELYDAGEGYQNILTYTIGFVGDQEGNLFLINTSNNGNGNKNLYDTSDEEYGKYHFTSESPNALSEQLLAAVNDILSRTSSFTAPVVPVTRTTSGNRIYMSFFKPGEENFWEGNVTKFGLSNDNEIVDKDGYAATWPNGAMKDGAAPYWATIDWADDDRSAVPANNGIRHENRNIYTYLGTADLNDVSGVNLFVDTNAGLTKAVLGNPTNSLADIINYVRGADVFDEDQDTNTTENRAVITGDVLHSEPSIFKYTYDDGSSKTMVYFGANDGMLHAALDTTEGAGGSPETSYGTEAWAFIPPDQLHRLKDMVEGTEHQYYVDSTPKIFFYDDDKDGVLETGDGDRVILVCGQRKGGTSYFALDVTDPDDPQYLWRVSQYNDKYYGTIELTNMTGTWQDVIWVDHINTDDPATGSFDGYVTPDSSTVESVFRYHYKFVGREFAVGDRVFAYKANGYADGDTAIVASISEDTPYLAPPDTVISQLGETWSEPQFGLVKTASGVDTHVLFVGGGYSSDNSKGKTVLAIDVIYGTVVKQFTSGMTYSFPGTVSVIDEDGDDYVDKVYAGDLGGQMWRFASFTNPNDGSSLTFPNCNEIIDHASYPWTGQVFFKTDENNSRKFFYPPSVTLEKSYDLIFMGTGDRENACCNNDTSACSSSEPDMLCAVKDTHSSTTIIGERDVAGTLYAKELVDVTDPADTPPNLGDPTGDAEPNGFDDKGWYIRLVDDSGNAVGEKVLAESTVFYKVFYITTFTPNDDPCMPGGEGKLYALSYLTGGAAMDFDDDDTNDRSVIIGGGIPSKPVMIIRDSGTNLLISVGSTNPDDQSEDVAAGVLVIDPVVPDTNFFYLWWRELFN